MNLVLKVTNGIRRLFANMND